MSHLTEGFHPGQAKRFLAPDGKVLSAEKLTPDAFREAAALLGVPVARYRKTMRVAARVAAEPGVVVTLWNGEETRNSAKIGDMLVTTLTADNRVALDQQGHANTYVMSAQRFSELYAPTSLSASDPDYGSIYDPRGEVEAFSARQGFEIMAPWGEIERAEEGYIVLNGTDVYGVAGEVFRSTYTISEN